MLFQILRHPLIPSLVNLSGWRSLRGWSGPRPAPWPLCVGRKRGLEQRAWEQASQSWNNSQLSGYTTSPTWEIPGPALPEKWAWKSNWCCPLTFATKLKHQSPQMPFSDEQALTTSLSQFPLWSCPAFTWPHIPQSNPLASSPYLSLTSVWSS